MVIFLVFHLCEKCMCVKKQKISWIHQPRISGKPEHSTHFDQFFYLKRIFKGRGDTCGDVPDRLQCDCATCSCASLLYVGDLWLVRWDEKQSGNKQGTAHILYACLALLSTTSTCVTLSPSWNCTLKTLHDFPETLSAQEMALFRFKSNNTDLTAGGGSYAPVCIIMPCTCWLKGAYLGWKYLFCKDMCCECEFVGGSSSTHLQLTITEQFIFYCIPQ